MTSRLTAGELGILSIVFTILVGLAIFGVQSCMIGPKQQAAAEKEARKFAADLGFVIDGASCADVDSDGDGYVSCTLRIGDQLKQIECRGAYSLGHGCRDPKLNVIQRMNGR